MALVKCFECGKKVSASADVCPYCGYPIAEKLLDLTNAEDKRNQLLNEFYLAEGDNIDVAEKKIIDSWSYTKKRNKKTSLTIASLIMLIIGLFVILFPIFTRDDIVGSEKIRWYIDQREKGVYEEEVLTRTKDIALQNPNLSLDEMMSILDEQIESELAPKVFIRQLPFFIFGVIFIIGSILCFKRSKKYILLLQDEDE